MLRTYDSCFMDSRSQYRLLSGLWAYPRCSRRFCRSERYCLLCRCSGRILAGFRTLSRFIAPPGLNPIGSRFGSGRSRGYVRYRLRLPPSMIHYCSECHHPLGYSPLRLSPNLLFLRACWHPLNLYIVLSLSLVPQYWRFSKWLFSFRTPPEPTQHYKEKNP